MEHTKYCTSTTGEDLVLFRSGWSVFSNFNICKMEINGVQYNCVEQWYQSEKARFFNDEEVLKKIMSTYRPYLQKQFAKEIKGFDRKLWLTVAVEIMETGLRAKINQNAHARAALIGTEQAIIAEASEFDTFWGIGKNIIASQALDISCWSGENNLGGLWMKIRDEM